MSLLYRKELKETLEEFAKQQVAPLTTGVDDSAIKDITTPVNFDSGLRHQGDPANVCIMHWVKRGAVSYMKQLVDMIKEDAMTLEAVLEVSNALILRPVQKNGVAGSGDPVLVKEDKKFVFVIERDFVNQKDANEYSITPRDLFKLLQNAL